MTKNNNLPETGLLPLALSFLRLGTLAFGGPGRKDRRIDGQWSLLEKFVLQRIFGTYPLRRIVCQKPYI